MIAYNKTGLDNLAIQKAVQEAVDNNCITREEQDAIKKKYVPGIYKPNIFIRIALFIATNIIGSFTLGLFSLILLAGERVEENFGIICIFFSMLTYAALEFMVKRFNHYKSGVDDALRWISGSFMIAGLNIIGNISWLGNAIILLAIAVYYLLRFPNRIVSVIASVSFFAVVFLAYIKLGTVAKATTPFLLMVVTALVYFVTKNMLQQSKWKYYKQCLTVITITALICFYFAANYFIVRETSNIMFSLNLQEGDTIPYGWLFWSLTILVPVTYIIAGIRRKDVVLLRTGLLLIAFTVFTLRYYYSVLPIETVMVIGGSLMIVLSLGFIQYLKRPKYGFTYLPVAEPGLADKINIEALVIAQTFTPPIAATNVTSFGGGSGGGAGASGQF